MKITEFFTTETVRAIDWGVLDSNRIKSCDIESFYFFESMLTLELEKNYRYNDSGIFRVEKQENSVVYTDEVTSQVIVAENIADLEIKVKKSNNIWYVFDEILASRLGGI